MAFCSALAAAPAHAGLLGSSGTLLYHFSTTTTSDSFVVGAGVEFTCPGSFNVCSLLTQPTQTIDIGNASIAYSFTSGNTGQFASTVPNGFDFVGLNGGSAIVGATISNSGIPGLDASRLSFTANSVQIDMHGLALSAPSSQFTVNLSFAPVPELPTPALLLAGLLAVQGWRRQRASRLAA